MAGPLKKDSWYSDHGVEPPDHIVHTGSDSIKVDSHPHKWEARGNFLHCAQGQNGHGIPYDHLNLILIGTDRYGAPIFRKVTLSSKVPESMGDVDNTTEVALV